MAKTIKVTEFAQTGEKSFTAAGTCDKKSFVAKTIVYRGEPIFKVQEDQDVIRDGPYRFVRHPSYTGAYLTYCGTALFLHAWYSAAAAALLLPLAFHRRIHHEEKHLSQHLDGYGAYQREVPALLPRPFR